MSFSWGQKTKLVVKCVPKAGIKDSEGMAYLRCCLLRSLGILILNILASNASPQLFVITPAYIRLNSAEAVVLSLQQSEPVDVKIFLQNYPDREKTFSMIEKRIESDRETMVNVVARPEDARGLYVYLIAECTQLNFRKEAIILLTPSADNLFLQTDKPIYTPDQTVFIRAISLNSSLLPSEDKFLIDIVNPNNDVVRRIDSLESRNGFVNITFEIPSVVVYGNWTVTASRNIGRRAEESNSSVHFEVKEYVLPTFSVAIKAPDHIIERDDGVSLQVTATYIFGKKVKGRASIDISLRMPYGAEERVGTLQVNEFEGFYAYDVTRQELEGKWFPEIGSRLVVRATVTEAATGKRESAVNSDAMFVSSPHVISFDRTSKYFRPGLPYQLNVDTTHVAQGHGVEVGIRIVATFKRRNQWVGLFGDGVPENDFRTTYEGRKTTVFDVPNDAEEIDIKVRTTDPALEDAFQASKEIQIRPHAASEYLVVQSNYGDNRPEVKDELTIRVDFSSSQKKLVTFIVTARGRIIQQFLRTVEGKTANEHISVKTSMSPKARILVYYARGDEIIADSILLEVVPGCDEELKISASNKEYVPKDEVQLQIQSASPSLVSLLAVDKAVYELSKRDVITRSKFFKRMENLDFGCGPGGGRDAADVFMQNGVILLSNVAHLETPWRSYRGCSETQIRKRRSVAYRRANHMLDYFDAEDRSCCGHGLDDALEDWRSCQTLQAMFGNRRVGCVRAYRQCCDEQKDIISSSRGRSDVGQDGMLGALPGGARSDPEPRQDFPETWFYDFLEFKRGTTSKSVVYNLPDSITTWAVSGISVSPQHGICVSNFTNIISRKSFFVHLDLPYAAKRNEQLEVKATVYNFAKHLSDPTGLVARVTMSTANDGGLCTGTSLERNLNIPVGSGKTITFPVVPLKVGNHRITVRATTNFDVDVVTRTLRVSAEGVRRSKTVSVRLDPQGIMGDAGSGSKFMNVTINERKQEQVINIPITFPDDAIPDTGVCSATIVGDLLGQMTPMANVDVSEMIELPTGCGEQVMMKMGPLVHTTRYMLETNNLDGELEKQAYEFILKGYENELAFKHEDGSFSAWQHYPPSSWLTALVTKTFCQASAFRDIGDTVGEHVEKSITWLISRAQRTDGSFYETHPVIHKEMMGQNLLNDVSFTSFVVEAISNCKDQVDLAWGRIAQQLALALRYLEANRHSQTHPYGQSILAYALTLRRSRHRGEANRKLRSMSSFDQATGMRYWNVDDRETEGNNVPIWYKETPPAAAVETASYALLNQLALDGIPDYFVYSGPIASWLIRQRTVTGAFVATADTMIGLEALTAYARKAVTHSSHDMQVKFRGNDEVLFQVRPFIPITIEKEIPIRGDLLVTASGSGLGQLQVECAYNSPALHAEVCKFHLEVNSDEYHATAHDLDIPIDEDNWGSEDEDDRSRFGRSVGRSGLSSYVTEIKIRFRYIGEGAGVGMSILEVTIFSGFTPVKLDLDRLKEEEKIDNYEITETSVIMYLKMVSKNFDQLISLRTKQEHVVGKTQPVAVSLYDYYEKDKHQCTKFYHPKRGSGLLATNCEDDHGDSGKRSVCSCVATECAEFWGFAPGRTKLMSKPRLLQSACTKFDYAIKVKAGETFVTDSVAAMTGEVESVLKLGNENLAAGEPIRFVWNDICPNPQMEPGVSYLVMGMDGMEYTDPRGRIRTKNLLDKNSHVVKWYSIQERRRYGGALNSFARILTQESCRS